MIFGEFRSADAEGLRLAHTIRLPQLLLRKGRALSAIDVAALQAQGVERVTGARLAPGDLDEDRAAGAVAACLSTGSIAARAPYTGRCNLVALAAGVLLIDCERIDRLNRISEAITLATLPQHAFARAGQRVATVKTIPFAVESGVVDAWRQVAGTSPPLRLAPLRPCRAALIVSVAPDSAPGLLDKASDVTRQRLEALGGTLALEVRCTHDVAALAQALRQALAAGCDPLLVLGATISKDRGDIVPCAIAAVGGAIEHFGMPVEPGNMLLAGRVGAVAVFNLPGCARSRSHNGIDVVLQRLLAGLPLASRDIMGLGVGGLMQAHDEHEAGDAEPIDPAPRRPARIAALVLAGGRSRRMGERNKLLCGIDGVPLVLHAINAACASRASQVMVVTGFESELIEAALAGRPVSFTHNPEFDQGMSASLRRGLRALPPDVDGAIVLLADMPVVRAQDIDRLLDQFDPDQPAVLVPEHGGRRGNPVLWPRRHFAEMAALCGDTGARGLLEHYASEVRAVPFDHAGIFVDVDTPEALSALAHK